MTTSIRGSRHDAASIVTALRGKGVRLWSDNGELRYRARKGVMSADELAQLSVERERIIDFLERAEGDTAKSVLRARQASGPAPLTHTQTALWDSGRRTQRQPMRQIASATRLLGRLDLAVLHASLIEVVRRHEALRTRIVVLDGRAMQDVAAVVPCDLRLLDFTALSPAQRDLEVKAAIRSLIVEPFHFDVGPLLAIQVAKLGDAEHVLMVALEHVIADAWSLNILLRDLLTIYARSFGRQTPGLPAIAIQFPDYAVWQRRTEKSWVTEHAGYWHLILDYPALRLPGAANAAPSGATGWKMVSALIPSERKLALRNWCQSHGTTPALFALTAFAALVLRWCAAREGVLRCITDGRTHPEVQDTIGFFAAPLYLHVALGACGTFLDLLTHLTHEYCDAYAHADLCYLQSTLPRSEAMRTPVFNWIPSEPKVEPVLLQGSADALACSNVEFDNPLYESFAMDSDPIMLVHDRSEDLAVELLYPRARFSAESMEHFVRCFMSVVDTMLEQPEQMVKGARLTEQG